MTIKNFEEITKKYALSILKLEQELEIATLKLELATKKLSDTPESLKRKSQFYQAECDLEVARVNLDYKLIEVELELEGINSSLNEGSFSYEQPNIEEIYPEQNSGLTIMCGDCGNISNVDCDLKDLLSGNIEWKCSCFKEEEQPECQCPECQAFPRSEREAIGWNVFDYYDKMNDSVGMSELTGFLTDSSEEPDAIPPKTEESIPSGLAIVTCPDCNQSREVQVGLQDLFSGNINFGDCPCKKEHSTKLEPELKEDDQNKAEYLNVLELITNGIQEKLSDPNSDQTLNAISAIDKLKKLGFNIQLF